MTAARAAYVRMWPLCEQVRRPTAALRRVSLAAGAAYVRMRPLYEQVYPSMSASFVLH
jgi:hypothetical protein